MRESDGVHPAGEDGADIEIASALDQFKRMQHSFRELLDALQAAQACLRAQVLDGQGGAAREPGGAAASNVVWLRSDGAASRNAPERAAPEETARGEPS
jgi:hypothetical protein